MDPHLGQIFAKNGRFMAISVIYLLSNFTLKWLRRPDANLHGLCYGLSDLANFRAIWPQRHLLSALYNRKKSVFTLSSLFHTKM